MTSNQTFNNSPTEPSLLTKIFGWLFIIGLFLAVGWISERWDDNARKQELIRDQKLVDEIIREHPYGNLIAELDSMQRQLRVLIGFIDSQKAAIQQKEATIAHLSEAEGRLRKIVEANRATVTAILEEESQKRAAAAWWERFISFAFGVVASLLATHLYAWWTTPARGQNQNAA